jgi:hypothetical protein
VLFPSPTDITVTWNGITASVLLESVDAPSDWYTWQIFAGPGNGAYVAQIIIYDQTNGFYHGSLTNTTTPLALVSDRGGLSFSLDTPVVVTPEPSTWLYAITAIFVGLALHKFKGL